jgi:hypothetical protein
MQRTEGGTREGGHERIKEEVRERQERGKRQARGRQQRGMQEARVQKRYGRWGQERHESCKTEPRQRQSRSKIGASERQHRLEREARNRQERSKKEARDDARDERDERREKGGGGVCGGGLPSFRCRSTFALYSISAETIYRCRRVMVVMESNGRLVLDQRRDYLKVLESNGHGGE